MPRETKLLTTKAYLEKRFNIRPLGVVSKKLIGDRKIAKAILSCNFREACDPRDSALAWILPSLAAAHPSNCRKFSAYRRAASAKSDRVTGGAYLDRAKDPEDQGLYNNQCCRSNPEREVDPKEKRNVWVSAQSFVD